MKRRKFIKGLSLSTSLAISPFISLESKSNEKSMFFEIGLAEWSLNKALNKDSSCPFYLCLDVGHGDINSNNPDNYNPYVWIKEFYKII